MGDEEKEKVDEAPPAPPAEEAKEPEAEADAKQPDLAPLHEGEKETPSAA